MTHSDKGCHFARRNGPKKRPRGCSAVAKLGSKIFKTVTVAHQVDSGFTSNSESSVVQKCDFKSRVPDTKVNDLNTDHQNRVFARVYYNSKIRNKMYSHC